MLPLRTGKKIIMLFCHIVSTVLVYLSPEKAGRVVRNAVEIVEFAASRWVGGRPELLRWQRLVRHDGLRPPGHDFDFGLSSGWMARHLHPRRDFF